MSSDAATNSSKVGVRQVGITLLVILLLPVILPLLLVYVAVYLLLWVIAGAVLHLAIWAWWCPRGKRVLLVYSNSPVWQDYFEATILPRLGSSAVVLNWSERQTWPRFGSLAIHAFRYFGGDREFNPLAVVFRPFRLRRTYRFWRPFREFKHGKPEAVETVTENLFALLDGRAEKILV